MFTLPDHDTMKARLLLVCEGSSIREHLYPRLLEMAGKELSIHDVFWNLTTAISVYLAQTGHDFELTKLLIPDIINAIIGEENAEFEKEIKMMVEKRR